MSKTPTIYTRFVGCDDAPLVRLSLHPQADGCNPFRVVYAPVWPDLDDGLDFNCSLSGTNSAVDRWMTEAEAIAWLLEGEKR